MDNRLVLIDAYPIIFGSYYALMNKPMKNSKGENTSIVYGFVNKLEMILKDYSPSHIAVVFDSAAKTFRHEMYPEYKAQRQATPEEIHASVPLIKKIVDAYNIPQFAIDGYEADDIVGTLAKRGAAEGLEVFMVTPDKDYAQLVDDNIKMLRITHGNGLELMDKKMVCEKWGIDDPSKIIDLLALMGDASDNIPGCKGVGEKTAVKLLQEFGSVESVIENSESIKGALKTKVQESVEMIKFSKILVTICTDVPIETPISDLAIKEKKVDEMLKIFNDLELKSFITKYTQKSAPVQLSLFDNFSTITQAEEKYSSLSELTSVSHDYKLIENQEDISQFLAKISTQDFFCFDTETTSTDVFSADLVGMSFCWKKNEAFFVLLPENRDDAQNIVDQFRPLFENDKIFKIGQNLKFDVLMLKQYGVEVKGELFDTMIAHYLIQPELRHGMDALAEQYLKYKTVTYEELTTENGKKNLPLRSVDKNRLADYAAEDADITFQLYEIFKEELVKNNLDKLFKTIEMPLMHVLCEMENAGVTIDEKSLKESSVKMTAEMDNIANEIYSLAGHSFNISSPKQVGEVIYNELNLVEKVKKTKGGQMSTSEDVLISLKSKHPIIEKILDFRGVKKLLSTYIDALPEIVNSHTGKIHTSFNQTVTSTGRLSSSNPNLQNIPVRDNMGREIRRCFVASDDCVFLSADYSQIELRVMAHVSEDEGLISSFLSGFDFHQDTASKIFKVPTEEVTKEMRSKAKTANFGILYGISAFGLAERLSISRDEAKQMIESYFEAFPKVYDFLEKTKMFAHEHEYVETLFGRRRFIQDINSRNGSLRQNAERNAINAPIQGTAADIIKMAMINIQREIESRGLKSRMIIQVHDELNFNVLKSEEDIMREIVKSEMENVFKMKVPLKVELSVASNWLDAH
ncbi:MAG: DNA polymerase I [Bacteroidales bacterium]|jgi:DNA polymerase-1|nr:DNA polymerase I [Bacteroidales bacterium]